ncbi:MAG: cytoplasmic protein [Thermoanaerobaculia bacterium]
MKRLSYLCIGAALGAFAASAAGRMTTQDPVTVSPQYDTVRFENDRIRVLEYRLEPGEKEGTHSHPPGVVYVLSDATLRTTRADEKASEVTGKAGEVLWRESTTHATENIGANDARALIVDLKPCGR